MGLLDKLTTDGSPYSYQNGGTPPINPGATQQSKLHANGNAPGYSLDGSEFSEVNSAFQSYNDGYSNVLPQPSLLDLNGRRPAFSSVAGSTQRLPYLDNIPG
jgi:hypothetical protein